MRLHTNDCRVQTNDFRVGLSVFVVGGSSRFRKVVLLIAMSVATASSWAEAATWFVSAARYGVLGSDGRSEATAFGTIQDAVDAATAGDTVKVLPGTYDKDFTQDDVADSCVKARVLVNKKLRIESTGGAAVTHIVGAGDFSIRKDGLGDDAIRCVSVFQAANGTVLKGFTFRDGHSRWYNNKNCNATHGGAVQYLGYDGCGVIIADSVVSNNVATRAGAVHRAKIVRSLLTHNRVVNNGGAATRNCLHYACILAHNGSQNDSSSMAAIADSDRIINCTIFGNGNGGVFIDSSDETKIFNTVVILTGNNTSADLRSIAMTSGNTKTCEFRNVVYDTFRPNGNTYVTENFTCMAGRTHETLMSPYTGDYRAVAGGPCDGTGDPNRINVDFGLADEFRGLDFYGNPLVVEGKVNIGAVAASATPVGGVHHFWPGLCFTIDGVEKSSNYGETLYVRGAVQTSQICVRDSGLSEVFNVAQSGAWTWRQYFDLTGKLYLNLPPKGSLVTNVVTIAAKVAYVDPVNGDDANDGSSPTNVTENVGPKKTLESVIYVLPAKLRCIVHAAEGVYDDGSTEGGGWTNRVVFWGDKHVLLKGAGEGKSVIKGELDTTDAAQNGCGPNALRCVYAKQSSGYDLCVQGFTLADGAVNGGKDAGPSSPYEGGAFYAGDRLTPYAQLIDCVVTNCAGSRGGAMYGGFAQRCVFKGNHLCRPGSESFRDMGMSASVIMDSNAEKEGVNTVANGDIVFINTTFCGNQTSSSSYGQFPNGSLIMNTVISKDRQHNFTSDPVLLNNYQSYNNETIRGFTYVADLLLANRDERDLRPRADSVLVGGGSIGDKTVVTNLVGTMMRGLTSAQWFSMTTATDVNGEPNFYVNGRPVAGAYQRPVGVVQITARASDEVSPTGTMLMETGESVTLNVNIDARRKYLGFRVNGELVATTETTMTYTMPDAPQSSLVTLEAAFNTNWYVNATSGDDANDGWTPETAKKTLVGAMNGPAPRDIVHAAAGVYNEGKTKDYKPSTTLCRVSVPEGVTLLGDDRDGTIIEGAYPSGGTGLGVDAVRGVCLAKNATLKNLTVRKGRTKSGGNTEESWGAGVLGMGRDVAFVEDCTITNCYGSRSGAGHKVTFRRCRLVGNSGASCGAAGRCCSYYNTYIASCGIINSNGNSRALQETYDFVNSTYDLDCYSAGATRDLFESGNAVIVNSVILQPNCMMTNSVSGSTMVSCGLEKMQNVVVAPGTVFEPSRSATTTFVAVNVTTNTAEEVALDPVTRVPMAGSCLIDAGDNSARARLADVDCAYEQRVSNGTIDIGCFEYDWRPRYGAKIGASVTLANPDAVLVEDGVYLPSGELVARWEGGAKRVRITAAVSGTGVLSLYGEGDEPIHCWTAESGSVYKLPAELAQGDLRFRYEPGVNDVGGATIASLEVRGGYLILK